MEHQHEIKVAVLEEQIKGLREQHKSHAEKTDKRFDDLSEKIEKRFDELSKQNGSIQKDINEGKGAYKFAVFVWSLISSILSSIAALVLHSFFSK